MEMDGGRGRSKSPGRIKSPNKRHERSTSPSKFTEKDFERKKISGESAKRRQNALTKVKGLKLDPSQWSRQELIDKLTGFAHFTLDSKTGVGVISSENRRLLSEDLGVLQEIMRRVTEIQIVNLSGCGLTDALFLELLNTGLKGLRHLKELRLQSNQLTGLSVEAIARVFSKTTRKLISLDLQFNNLGFADGKTLFTAFSESIQDLNGLQVGKMLGESSALEILTLSNSALRLGELGIICGIVGRLKRIDTLNLAGNRINAEGLALLVEELKQSLRHVRHLDLSHNPVTMEGKDMHGIEALALFAKQSTQLLSVTLEGVLTTQGMENQLIQHSLMANRAVEGQRDGYYFNKFAQALIQRTQPGSAARAQLTDWQGSVKDLDLPFIRRNRVPQVGVSVLLKDQSGTGRDEILVVPEVLRSPNIVEF